MRPRLRKAPVIVTLSLLLLTVGSGGPRLSAIELSSLPYQYDIILWEITHLPEKWIHKLKNLLPWDSNSREERLAQLRSYFEMGEEARRLEIQLATPTSQHQPALVANLRTEQSIRLRLKTLSSERSRIKAGVEETLESEVSAVLEQEGLKSGLGFVFPPVDLALSNPPRVLVTSPRDRIERLSTLLLKPNMRVEDMESLEDKVLEERDLAALVTGIGGVATYPTIVRADTSLRRATDLAAHEWLHTYWFFRPLGWKFWAWTAQMNTLNETAADLAGEEIGDRVYAAVTGISLEDLEQREQSSAGEAEASEGIESPAEDAFDFDDEMRRTRRRVDELLSEKKVDAAEAYMEKRRRLFIENGFHIRKLNQAYFAFQGTYAASAASVSPIGSEIEQLRTVTDSVGDFVRTMAGFGSYEEFKEYLAEHSGSAVSAPVPSHAPVPLGNQSPRAPNAGPPTPGPWDFDSLKAPRPYAMISLRDRSVCPPGPGDE